MTKDDAIDLMLLLSAIESWAMSCATPIQDHMLDRIAAAIGMLRKVVLADARNARSPRPLTDAEVDVLIEEVEYKNSEETVRHLVESRTSRTATSSDSRTCASRATIHAATDSMTSARSRGDIRRSRSDASAARASLALLTVMANTGQNYSIALSAQWAYDSVMQSPTAPATSGDQGQERER